MLIDYKDKHGSLESSANAVEPQLMPRLWDAYQKRLQRLATEVASVANRVTLFLSPKKERVFVAAYSEEQPFPRFVVVIDYEEKTPHSLLGLLGRHCSVEALAWEPYSPGTSEERLQDMCELMDWLSEQMGCDPFFLDFPESPNQEVTLWSSWLQ